MLPDKDLDYFGDEGDRMHMMFNFLVNQNVFYALATGDARPLAQALERTRVSERDRRSGRTSCATTTSSISAG